MRDTKPKQRDGGRIVTGDQLPALQDDAVNIVIGWIDQIAVALTTEGGFVWFCATISGT